jgi:lipid II:glycine glycyltransferase (peptidoglycan interpeptide bridge formation enzyme)
MVELVYNLGRKEWEDFVQSHPKGNIFQSPEMARIFRNTKNYEPILTAGKTDGEVVALMLGVIAGENSAIKSLSRRSIIQGGPLLNGNDPETLTELLWYYNNLAAKKALFTQIRTMWDTNNISHLFLQQGFGYEERLNFLIDLDKPIKEIWYNIPKSRRKNIKRAEKKSVEIEEVRSKSLIPTFYNLIKETYSRVKIPVADISLFEASFEILVPKKMARFYLARYQDEYIASRVVLTYKDLIYDWYAGISSEHMDLYANEALVWQVLKDGVEDGFHTFNFGGAGKPGENAGRYVFKRRFGGKEVRHGRYTKVHSLLKLKIAEAGYKVYRKILA